MEDPRKTHLRKGLSQLSRDQLLHLLQVPKDSLITDEYYYHDGYYWPLAAALKVSEKIKDPTNNNVRDYIIEMGYDLNSMKGIAGTFYTNNRYDDLISLIQELLGEI